MSSITYNTECNSLSECKGFDTIKSTLTMYGMCNMNHTHHAISEDDLNKILDNFDFTQILNAFNHLLLSHSSEFERVYNSLNETIYDNKDCNISKCLLFHRNRCHRDTLKSNSHLYFTQDAQCIVRQQMLDRIHSYCLHSFDIGHKLRRNNSQVPTTEHNPRYDVDIQSITQSMKSLSTFQLPSYCNTSNRFTLLTNPDQYSYGYRYFYWTYYKNNANVYDDAHWGSQLNCISHPVANSNSTLKDWYVYRKYNDLEEEMTQNATCCISKKRFSNDCIKATEHLKGNVAKSKRCCREKSATYYDIRPNQLISVNHLTALLLYCNCDSLQFEFTKTYRKNDDETDKKLIQRHREYWWLGKLLRECIECFGDDHAPPDHLYHGICGSFTFSSIFACIKGPLSTTSACSVALAFCSGKGMVLDLQIYSDQWIYKFDEGTQAAKTFCCFDCVWISDHCAEQETLFIGGMSSFIINTIIEVHESSNYQFYIDGIKHCTYNCLTDDAHGTSSEVLLTPRQQHMVFRLLAHALYQNDPNHPNAVELKDCPPIITNLLHAHLSNIIEITIENTAKFPDRFFKCERYDWIELDLIIAIYPNIQKISYKRTCTSNGVSFFNQQIIYESTAQLLSSTKEIHLNQICITIKNEELLINKIKKCIENHHYASRFLHEHSWDADIICIPQWTKNVKNSIRTETIPSEKVEFMLAPTQIVQSLPKVPEDVYDTPFLVTACLLLCTQATWFQEHV
eukprot:234353_1